MILHKLYLMEKYTVWKLRNISVFLELFICLVQVECQCDDATRPLVLSSSNTVQYFSSPAYPDDYPPNADCAWYIEAPSEYDKIILNVEQFRSQQDEFLNIYDGSDATGDPLEQIDDTNQKQFNAYVSPGHQLYFTFQSDGANQQKGFNILFFSNNSANQYQCGETITTTSEAALIMSPNLPNQFAADDNCNWLFSSTSDTISFQIVFLDMASCKPEYLSFYDGTSNTDPLLAQVCATAYTYTFDEISTTGFQAYVEWTVSSNAIGYGFMIAYVLSGGANSTNDTAVLGINMTYPQYNETVELTIPEDQQTGYVNQSIAVIILTYTGSLSLNIDPSYEATTDQTIDLSQVQVFSFDDSDLPYLYLYLSSSLDYEVINKFSLLVTIDDSDVPEVTYTVTFNITITDVNDEAPTILNLPYNVTLSRNKKSGEYIYTVNATDSDETAEFRIITYNISSGNTDAIFGIGNTSGEVNLIRDANQIPTTVVKYDLSIAASSEAGDTKLDTFETLTVYIDPDSPPVCTHSTVWADMLDINTATAGTTVTFLDSWSCTDDNNNITYSIHSVNPNLTSPAFEIDNATGHITILRAISPTEVANRQFLLEIYATDSVGQTETFNLYMNVTAMSCLPNPRNLYVRMDQELGGVILSDFNCTIKSGLSFTLKEYPKGTFAVNQNYQLILTASVVKIKFYSLTVTITDGVDVSQLKFKVIVQTKRCGVASGITPLSYTLQNNKIGFMFLLSCVTILVRYVL
ncbi:cadherin-23-like [Mercenaria mercenaria]|uniref:cadherin-23-like n=1 Tax=Mercenaria mercenaria TaxID=6596 RepID=UPI00234FA9B5|nr:cadherin-23-like [Mercenaria mercenaria]